MRKIIFPGLAVLVAVICWPFNSQKKEFLKVSTHIDAIMHHTGIIE